MTLFIAHTPFVCYVNVFLQKKNKNNKKYEHYHIRTNLIIKEYLIRYELRKADQTDRTTRKWCKCVTIGRYLGCYQKTFL